MPTISRFYGIVIRMYYQDHPPAHFHAVYGKHELVVGVMPITVLEGKAPARVRSMVLEWAAPYQQALLADWERCRKGQVPDPIPPLE